MTIIEVNPTQVCDHQCRPVYLWPPYKCVGIRAERPLSWAVEFYAVRAFTLFFNGSWSNKSSCCSDGRLLLLYGQKKGNEIPNELVQVSVP